ncbi:MAG TPA: hypothetical protein VKA27_12555, partial [Sunxiuqinia sp.]|nr:hypothetical protein [Sunxiuqinia sp.]
MRMKHDNEQQRNADRITTLISSLSSQNEQEREMTVEFCNYLVDQGQFPNELLPIFKNLINSANRDVSEGATQVLQKIAEKNPDSKVTNDIKQTIAERNPIVYIQYTTEDLKGKANAIRNRLNENNYNAPATELVKAKVSGNQIRYFKAGDTEIPNQIKQMLDASFETDFKLVDLSQRYQGKTRDKMYEIWLAN